jgi:hypothetical protein
MVTDVKSLRAPAEETEQRHEGAERRQVLMVTDVKSLRAPAEETEQRHKLRCRRVLMVTDVKSLRAPAEETDDAKHQVGGCWRSCPRVWPLRLNEPLA